MPAADTGTVVQSVDAVIPAYNEGPRVLAVARIARDSGLFGRVIVVDDGSSDDTAAVVTAESGLELVRHERNRGKSQAMRSGFEASQAELLCYLDADLLNVTASHLADLLEPVRSGRHSASLAVFTGGRALTSLAQRISPLISGQRCIRRELLESFTDWDSRFGVESSLNDHLEKLGVEQCIVEWPGAAQVMKEEKRGCIAGFTARLGMYRDILASRLRRH
ncbi:glycosyltransferase family 2 protein [bacterium]|nr:glycosyltransferase family 2 protein [bacterium]